MVTIEVGWGVVANVSDQRLREAGWVPAAEMAALQAENQRLREERERLVRM